MRRDLKSSQNRNSSGFVAILLAIIIVIGLLGVWFWLKNSDSKLTLPRLTNNSSENKQWVNCDDVREVVQEKNKLYVACLGGVIIVDSQTGEVVDQITMTEGLGSATTTALVKRGSTLYIGTQDGFTEFDLSSRKAKKISVDKGLVNGSNILFAEDGDILWVGTFNGVSRYNTKTGEIKNFTSELADNSTHYGVRNILVTPKAVYFSIIASSYSPGGLARFDKATGSWERIGPSKFGETGEYARIDLFSLESSDNKILGTSFNKIWQAEDKAGASWQDISSIIESVSTKENAMVRLVGKLEDKVLMLMGSENQAIYAYDAASGKADLVYPECLSCETPNIIGHGFIAVHDGKAWVKGPENWLSWVDLQTKKSGVVDLKGRPEGFYRVIALIDGKPLIVSRKKVFSYESQDEFKEISALSDFQMENAFSSSGLFLPLPDSQKIFVFSQNCGQACDAPKLAFYDYLEGSIKPISLPEQLLQKIKFSGNGSTAFGPLFYIDYSAEKNEATFNISTTTGNEKAIFNISTSTWKFNSSGEQLTTLQVPFCNPSYTFQSNGNKFKKEECAKTGENEEYRWSYFEPKDGELSGQLYQENKKTGEKVVIEPPAAPFEYSPFPEAKPYLTVSSFTFSHGKLWVGTNRGLSMYDPKSRKWKLISTDDGLVSNKILHFAVGDSVVWVVSDWGGLSKITY